jgi:tetratricopeptide (TPR) repeat protein
LRSNPNPQYQKAVEIDPDYATAYNNLGYAYEKIAKYDEAINTFETYKEKTEDPDEQEEIQKHIDILKIKLLE